MRELQYLKFTDLLDPKTKKTSVRTVDLAKPSYKVAREYMIRLEKEDFDIPSGWRNWRAAPRARANRFQWNNSKRSSGRWSPAPRRALAHAPGSPN